MKALKDAEAKALEGVESRIRTGERVRPTGVPAPEVDVEKKGLDRKTNHQPRRSQGRRSRHLGETRWDRGRKFVVACTLVRGVRGHKPRRGDEIPLVYGCCTQYRSITQMMQTMSRS